MARCPTCRGDSKLRDTNPAFPFCSPRCRAVDLGRWFGGEYRVPGRAASPDERPSEPEEGGPGPHTRH